MIEKVFIFKKIMLFVIIDKIFKRMKFGEIVECVPSHEIGLSKFWLTMHVNL